MRLLSGAKGGMPGAERLSKSAALLQILNEQIKSGKIWSAICASPAVVFESQGWLKGKKATSHPAFSDKLADQRCAAIFPLQMEGQSCAQT